MNHTPEPRVRETLWRLGAGAIALLLLQSINAHAEDLMPLARIAAAAEEAVRARLPESSSAIEVKAESLDERLRLASCAAPLYAFVGGDGVLRERTSVGVRCDGPIRWMLYVVVHVSSELPVLSARVSLPQGAGLRAEDFVQSKRRVAGLPSQYVGDPAALTGQRLRRPIAAGSTLTVGDLMALPLVHRGQTVTLLASAQGIEVRVAAIALADGAADERIKVQSLPGRHEVEAIVRGTALVEVPL